MNLTPQTKLEILCAYLPHGVGLMCDGKPYQNLLGITLLNPPEFAVNYGWGDAKFIKESNIQPILRHPDDMKEDELSHLGRLLWNDQELNENIARENAKDWLKGHLKISLRPEWAVKTIQYLHSLHIDTFGSIEAGWAIRKETN